MGAADESWYSWRSAFNTPIPTNPPVHPDTLEFVAGLGALRNTVPFIGLALSSTPAVGVATGEEAPLTVRKNYPACGVATYTMQLPDGFVVEQDYESPACVMLPDGTEWNFYQLTPPGAPTLSSSGGPAAGACPSTEWGANVVARSAPDNEGGGWRGKGYPVVGGRLTHIAFGAGLIRLRDLSSPPGSIWPHALAASYGAVSGGAGVGSDGRPIPNCVAPASRGIGPSAETNKAILAANQRVPAGARFQLDPAFVIPSAWPEWKQQACRTLQRFGAIIVDQCSAGLVFFAEYAYTRPHRTGTFKWLGLNGLSYSDATPGGCTGLAPTLADHFRVIDYTLWTGA